MTTFILPLSCYPKMSQQMNCYQTSSHFSLLSFSTAALTTANSWHGMKRIDDGL
ncbi:hypothetical protein Pla100_50120 [Neorhodopirellula pilleata]|uniref:Uncharacterized protein n=1 Tax=Neorhodopirellula pilleata TaxID=2714738 RepID=A0A5C5ZX51_9BACT|nr:hypothetical protein Pla100_50120 [Neorhodopirellula pilleata]